MAWVRGCVGGMDQILAWVVWVAWVHKSLAWVAWVEILAWVEWVSDVKKILLKICKIYRKAPVLEPLGK